ncbi:MAG: ABC transporter substrate-binding protein [Anaeromyxobacteraceae bacterium]
MTRRVLFRLALLVLVAAVAPSAASAASPSVLRVGTNRALGTVTPYIGKAKGFFNARGIQLEIVDFQDGSTLMEAFAAGRLDVALAGIAPTAIWQGKGVPLKVIAAANGGGHVLLTRSDAGIGGVEGLRGRKVGTPKQGTVVDTLVRAHILRELASLEPERDVTLIAGLAPADLPAALFVTREVDAIATWEPFASQAQARFPEARILWDGAAEWRKAHPGAPLYPVNVVIARQDLIDGRPDDVRRFLAAYDETIRFVEDRRDDANALIAQELKLAPAIVSAARGRIDYSSRLDISAALRTLAWSKELGYLKVIPTEAALFDLRFLPAPAAAPRGPRTAGTRKSAK